MRGTNSREAFKLFMTAAELRGLPLTLDRWERSDKLFRQAIEVDTGKSFDEARKSGIGFPRAWSWLAYGITMSYFLGREGKKEDLLREAFEYLELSLKLDPHDYQNHWVAAFMYMVDGDIGQVETHKEEALFLNAEDQNLSVVNEMADVLVWLGQTDEAIHLLDRTRRIGDWNRWSMAWAFYAKAKDDTTYYDRALEEIDKTFRKPGDEKYEFDIDLLAAVIHAQKASNFDRIGDKGNAQKNRDLANSVKERFLTQNRQNGRKEWTIADETRRMPFAQNDTSRALLGHWIDGLRKLGLAED